MINKKKGVIFGVFFVIFLLGIGFSSALPDGWGGELSPYCSNYQEGFSWDDGGLILNSTTGYDLEKKELDAQNDLIQIGMNFYSTDASYSENKIFELKVSPVIVNGEDCLISGECPSAFLVNRSSSQGNFTCYDPNFGVNLTKNYTTATFVVNDSFLESISGGYYNGEFLQSYYPSGVDYNITINEIYDNHWDDLISSGIYNSDFSSNPIMPLNLSIESGPTLDSTFANWSNGTDVLTSDTINLTLIGEKDYQINISGFDSYFNGKSGTVKIYEDNLIDSLSGTVSGGVLSVNWNISEADINSAGVEDFYIFYPQLNILGLTKSFSSTTLNVTLINDSSYVAPTIDLDYAVGIWTLNHRFPNEKTSLSVSEVTTNREITLYVSNITAPEDTIVYFDIYEKDTAVFAGGDDDIEVGLTTLNGTVDANGIAYFVWNITDLDLNNSRDSLGEDNPLVLPNPSNSNTDTTYEYYFKVRYNSTESKTFDSKILEVTDGRAPIVECSTISYCSGYDTGSLCNSDYCGVADASSPSQYVDCSDPSVQCSCSWDSVEESCGPSWVTGTINESSGEFIAIGSCVYSEDLSNDDCSDGYLKYSWTALWNWATTGLTSQPDGNYTQGTDGKWYYDPERVSEDCKEGSDTLACPAQVQLPFFSWFNLVIALIILIIIYYFITKPKKNKHSSAYSKAQNSGAKKTKKKSSKKVKKKKSKK